MSAGPHEADVGALLAVLETREHWPRVEAIEVLGTRGVKDAIPALLEILEDDVFECWHTKAAALEALVALDARHAGPAMIGALTDARQDPDVRIAAARALAALEVADAEVPLRRVAALERDNDIGATARASLNALTADR